MKPILLDTCFIVYEIKQGNQKKLEEFCEKNDVRITSFNMAELEHVEKHLPHDKKHINKFLKNTNLPTIELDVKPGEHQQEKDYVNKVDNDLLRIIQDPSDAVLVACAIENRCDVLTRDKHHIFSAELENKLNEYGIEIRNGMTLE